MSKPQVKMASAGAGIAALDAFKDVQGDLKTLSNDDYERLKAEILSQGFSFPPNVWVQDQNLHLIDGHQRIKTLRKMRAEGYVVPDEIPYSIVQAEDYQAAKRKVLAGASTYGKATEKGFTDFVASLNIAPVDLANFRLPEINIPKLIEKMASSADGDVSKLQPGPLPKDAVTDLPSSSVRMVQLYFSPETHPEFLEKISQLEKAFHTGNVTDTVLEAVRAAHSAKFPTQ